MIGTRTVFFEDHGHPGRDGVAYLHRLPMIDEAWTTWHDDGFTWWGHTLAQRYRWEGPVDVDGVATWFQPNAGLLRGLAPPMVGNAWQRIATVPVAAAR